MLSPTGLGHFISPGGTRRSMDEVRTSSDMGN